MRTHYSKLLGKEVMTDMGLYIGMLKDIDIDVKTGKIKALLIMPPEEDEGKFLWSKKKKKSKISIIKKIPRTKDGLLIIPGNTIKSAQEFIVIDAHKFSKILP